MTQPHAQPGPRIYYLHPLAAGPLATWSTHFAKAADLGFDHVLVAPPFSPMPYGSLFLSATHDTLHPALGWAGGAIAGLADAAHQARDSGVGLLLDVVPARVADASPLARAPGSPFSQPDTTLDPRRFDPDGDTAHAPLDTPAAIAHLADFWVERLGAWANAGVAGFRFTSLRGIPPALIRAIADGMAGHPVTLIGWMAGIPLPDLATYAGCGLDHVCGSLPWWDTRGDWFWREAAALRRIAPVITASEAPFGPRLAEHEHSPAERIAQVKRGLNLAALLGSGWMMVGGTEHANSRRLDPRRDAPDDARLIDSAGIDLSDAIRALNASRDAIAALNTNGEPRVLVAPGADILAIARSTAADTRLPGDMAVVAINLAAKPQTVDLAQLCINAGGYYALPTDAVITLDPGDACTTTLGWQSFAAPPRYDLDHAARVGAKVPRIAIEAVTPSVDGGRFPARYVVGERVAVQADIICDGHDVLAAEVRWRAPGDAAGTWQHADMRPLGNDRWQASFPLTRLGVHEFTVEAWKDVYATYRDELSKKFAAGLDVTLEIEEGRLLVASTLVRSPAHKPQVAALGKRLLTGAPADKVAILLSDDTASLMRDVDARAFATWGEPPFPVEAERTAAQFASWYEIFPRSMSGDEARHGTFDDVIAQLPRIQGMGFDVLYFPPIHPIGRKNRKGRNNTLEPAADDPGSPYGIADHTAIHAQLGTIEDFRRLRDAALYHGMELALDFAIQCSPDHPWLAEHKGWFDWRPDGSIRYAENPPKKYQDIVNVDFYRPDALDGLWRTLCEVVLFWCAEGVRIFRVDNPHTKPLPFWQWMIDEVKIRYPDAMFLAEAFTKPKMMNRLAKVGFSQSYTYFTWRTSKSELQDYLIELTTTPARAFFRPNFFVNTPDINPVFLQHSGRPGHLIRAALAATLAGLWGVYSGFELCDATPLPGREEYADSEKYQLRVWDWDRPGNIVAEITRLNWMRRLNPALQTHLGVTFLQSNNDQVIYFEKATEDRSNVVLVAINLDPYNVQEALFEVPLWRWSLPDWASVTADDLVFDVSTVWAGKMQHVRLDPNTNPYAVWRVRPV